MKKLFKEKRIINIKGAVMEPIVEGRPAFVCQEGGIFRKTSNVLAVESISTDEVKFETENSIYFLTLISPPSPRRCIKFLS